MTSNYMWTIPKSVFEVHIFPESQVQIHFLNQYLSHRYLNSTYSKMNSYSFFLPSSTKENATYRNLWMSESSAQNESNSWKLKERKDLKSTT